MSGRRRGGGPPARRGPPTSTRSGVSVPAPVNLASLKKESAASGAREPGAPSLPGPGWGAKPVGGDPPADAGSAPAPPAAGGDWRAAVAPPSAPGAGRPAPPLSASEFPSLGAKGVPSSAAVASSAGAARGRGPPRLTRLPGAKVSGFGVCGKGGGTHGCGHVAPFSRASPTTLPPLSTVRRPLGRGRPLPGATPTLPVRVG